MAVGLQVAFDAADPDKLARFWATMLGYRLQPPPEGYDDWPSFLRTVGIAEEDMDKASAIIDPDGTGPRIYFQKVPEPKTAKNRVHLDLNVGGGHATPIEDRKRAVAAVVERATALGATVLYEHEEYGEFWVTLTDPEGNEFCLQ